MDEQTTTTAAGGDRAAHVETILRIHQGFAADTWLKRVGFARTSASGLPAPRGVVMGWKA